MLIRGETIRAYRDANGIKQKFVADKAGIDPRKLCRIENQRQPLNVDDLESICIRGLGITPKQLMKWEEDNAREKGVFDSPTQYPQGRR